MWSTAIGVVLLLYSGYVLYRGRIASGNDYDPTVTYINRSEHPVRFWFSMILLWAVAAMLLFNVFHF